MGDQTHLQVLVVESEAFAGQKASHLIGALLEAVHQVLSGETVRVERERVESYR